MSIGCLAALAIAVFLASSCGGNGKDTTIELPGERVMRLGYGWGVVLLNYVRIRATPAADGIEVTALARYAVVRVIDKGRRETTKTGADFWYQVEAGSNRGWLFGSYLKVFHDRDEAVQAAAELKAEKR
ncbi:MAG: SH3 domain-containing protein [Spirochaetales bacterium]|nr:SH3 domain-containing protein [Spirochaetales bacterium]